ncbi:5-methylcytosine-specific restriction enzyme subunit McrC [Maribacter aquivivus]|uniref:5-methylcytosine-specific restriction enzyme subunit McrC n=1 Tax=Maribacter aquivivus TaxID=228958 RepID=A0A1M6TTP3_9FLAO|nr:restriction endonuclease [Maribacter aquivivus]SHK60299.1 5-methylcytosine-specific restriction enzyme subunit McrC [Maribacter aquivivus]
MNKDNHLTVFEHEVLRTDRGDKKLTDVQLKSMQEFYGESGVPYYSLVHNGVKFCEYVGVLQIGDTLIEILPKIDKGFSGSEDSWRIVLIDMLRAAGVFDLKAPSSGNLKLKSNSILHLYFELFIKEVKYLLRQGLVKKYRRAEGNNTSLKGNLKFGKHISQNLVHQERFYIQHTVYDSTHELHSILFKAIKLLVRINTNQNIHGPLKLLELEFPEMPDVKITEATFNKLTLNRKTQQYEKAIQIARLLLLNFHPDVSKGSNHILALMFDMNSLWEQFVYVSLRKYKDVNTTIAAQSSMNFWKPSRGYNSTMRPDIVLNKGKEDCVVLDTKWKHIKNYNPSPQDLRQMFTYMKYYKAKRVALLYPAVTFSRNHGRYYDHNERNFQRLGEEECSVISLPYNTDIRQWQKEISMQITNWVKGNDITIVDC